MSRQTLYEELPPKSAEVNEGMQFQWVFNNVFYSKNKLQIYIYIYLFKENN